MRAIGRYFRWLVVAIALAALAASVAGLYPFWAPHVPLQLESAAPVLVLMLPPALLIALGFWARLALDAGPSAVPRGELEHLLDHKRLSTLKDNSRRRWDDADTRISASPTLTREIWASAEAADDVLERLVKLKRQGGLGSHT